MGKTLVFFIKCLISPTCELRLDRKTCFFFNFLQILLIRKLVMKRIAIVYLKVLVQNRKFPID